MSAVPAVRSRPVPRPAVTLFALVATALTLVTTSPSASASAPAPARANAAPATAAAATQAMPMLNWPPPVPVRYAHLLQVSEIVANSPNANGGDAFEYIEVRNASDTPQAWDDFTVRYLYPLVDHTTVASVSWPTRTKGAVIAPGHALVLWVRNGASAGQDVADFNAAYGTSLVAGEGLVEIEGDGLANTVMRGIEISSRAGVQLSRAYYNEEGDADAVAASGVQFGPAPGEGEIQPRISVGRPSPGSVAAAQVGATLVTPRDTADAPRIVDQEATSFTPGKPFDIEAWITDDELLRTVTLELETNLDPPVALDVTVDEMGVARHSLGAADTVGRSTLTYRFVATDGVHEATSEARSLASSIKPKPLRIGGGQSGQPLDATLVAPTVPTPLTRRDGGYVSGRALLVAGGDAYPARHSMTVDGQPVTGEPELEHEAIFAFDATLTDPYFRNGVVMNGEVLTVFDEGFLGETRTVETTVPLAKVNPGEEFSLRIYAGTKAAPAIDPGEANDDFVVTNLRLALPDGRMVRPVNIADPAALIDVGDNEGSVDFVVATFRVPDDAFTALGYDWDTTRVPDGEHEFAATDGDIETALRVNVDNTGPAVVPSLMPGTAVRGEVILDAEVTDGGAGVDTVTATLDGAPVRLPHELSSLTDDPGDHVAVITAVDLAGNESTISVPYSIPREAPQVSSVRSASAASADRNPVVSARVEDSLGDALDVTIARGEALTVGDEVRVSVGEATDALAVERPDARTASAAEVEALGERDAFTVTSASDAKLPYVLIDTAVPPDATGQVHLTWQGSSNPNAKVLLYVLDPATRAWVEVDRHVSREGRPFALDAEVDVERYARDGKVVGLVQHSEGFARDDASSRSTPVDPNHPGDTPRNQYDFTLAWESDTQYYNARADIYDRQTSIHDFLLSRGDDINLQYLIHTGDIVDWSEDEAQWERADAAYDALDAAELPYGVLAGNHDVNQRTNDYTAFSRQFGDARFASNPWFGGSYEDNRGHYDLITAGGIDFLFLYMGWGAGDDEIAWMNEVLAHYPERVAMVNLHEYMLTTGGLGPLPQRIYDEVVATNPNVRFVFSGHYHDAYTRLDAFDDDGDGADDRTVTSMLFDYQDLANGGDGYLRLLHFDNQGQRLTVRTFSDYLGDYDAVNPVLDQEHQEFEVPYAQAGITVRAKELVTDTIAVDLLTDEVVASFDAVPAGTEVRADWTLPADDDSWYLRVTDPYGAQAVTEVRAISTPAGAAD